MVQQANVVELKYDDLLQGKDLTELIGKAYGKDGLGILFVTGVPGWIEKRQRLLPLGHTFANLPEEVKAKYEDAKSDYSFGWSHGKEKLEDGRLDTFKGSFYANPQYDRPTEDETEIKSHPEYCTPNIWPDEDIPELADAFKAVGQQIVSIGELIAGQCDQYAKRNNSKFSEGRLAKTIKESRTCKARLLHYFPADSNTDNNEDNEDVSSWCGWHNDHGSLTGLTKAMYFDKDGNEIPNPDPSAGLYIRDRAGNLHKGNYPADAIAYQIGETAQIHTGGILRATPHCVRAAKSPGVARVTFACFMQPNWQEEMDTPEGVEQSEVEVGAWKPGMNFAQFSKETLAKYYKY